MDLSLINIENWKERALSYCVISNEYETWVPVLKSRIRTAEDSELGTFIVASALLKAAIPQAHIEEVEKQISYNNEYRRYINQIRIEKHNRVKTCTKWSTIFSIVGAVLLILLAFSSNLSSDLFVNSQFWSCTYGTLLFSLIGGISIGYIIGCLPLSTIKDGMAFTLSSLLGLFTSIICPVCPPISLILAWVAYHYSSYIKPKVFNESTFQSVYKKTHGTRVFADNPRAPEYVKNALRLAGIYQDSDGFIAEIAKEALSRKQSDYGAFLAYEAFLLDHHINLDRENVYKGIYDANNSTNNSSDNSKKKNWKNILIKLAGIFSSILTSVIFNVILFINKAALTTKFSNGEDFIIYFLCIVFITISIFIGVLSTRRVWLTYGLNNNQRFIISICRSSWFSAWVNLILVCLVIIFSLS